MLTVTIRDTSTRQAKALIALLRTLSFVEVHEKKDENYDPEFVKKVREAAKVKKRIEVSARSIWESIK